MKKRALAIAAGTVALALGLSACASTPTTSDSSSGAAGGVDFSKFSSINAQPYSALKDGGSLNLSIGDFTAQLNRAHTDTSTDTSMMWFLYNPEVIKFTPEGELKPNPNYLTSVKDTEVDGNTVVTYEINPKAVFNDGTPIDVAAFKHTWQLNNGSNPDLNVGSTDGWNQITSVEAGKDDHEAVVTFDGAWPWWGGVFNFLLHPACDTAECFNTGYLGDDLASAHPEWGAGPYKLQSYDRNAGNAVFVKNEKWWGEPGKLDQITLTQREMEADLNAFSNGEADSTIRFSAAESLNKVKTVPGTQTRAGVAAGTYMLQLNVNSGVLKDINVRKAIMTAVDPQQITDVRFQGMGYTEKQPGSLLLFTYQKGYEDNFAKVVAKPDPAAAKKILEDAGYALGSDGIYAKDGQPIHVAYTLFGDGAANKAQAQVIQSQLKSIGVDMEIVPKASADFSSVMASGDWQMNFSGFSSSDPFGVAYTCQIWCSKDDPNYSGLNKSGTGTKALDEKIHAMEALQTADEQIKAANAIEVEEFAQYGLMPVMNGPIMFQVKEGLANLGAAGFSGNGNPTGDFIENIGWVK